MRATLRPIGARAKVRCEGKGECARVRGWGWVGSRSGSAGAREGKGKGEGTSVNAVVRTARVSESLSKCSLSEAYSNLLSRSLAARSVLVSPAT
jgi:hypothetical protein